MQTALVNISKFISFVLRHQPEAVGLTPDAGGWVAVDDLIAAAQKQSIPLDRALLETIVGQNDKQRFAFSDDGLRIRANQGHSFPVDLGLAPLTPPEFLYHGTATRFLNAIREQGLRPGSRQQVHLSGDEVTARTVGQRHGKPVVLTVLAGRMFQDRFLFYRSANGVWLTDAVPAAYLRFPA